MLPPVKKPLRNLLLAAALLLGGFMIGLVVTGSLETVLEPILVYFSPKPTPPSLVPIDFDPFADEYICELNLAQNICI